MALFDQSQFDPQSFLGGQTGWLQQALQSGLLGRALGQQTPMQPQTGLTGAQGSYGSMGGVPFPIAPGPDPYGQQAQLPPNAQPAGPAQAPQPQSQVPELFGGGIAGKLQNALAPLNPQAAQITMSRQLMQAQLQALMQQPGMTAGRAMAMLQNPALQAQYYGATKLAPGEQLVPNMGAFGGQGSQQSGASNTTGIFDKPTLTTMADQYLAGDKSVLQNLGRSSLGALNVTALRQRIAERMTEKDITPEEQAVKMAEYTGLTSAQTTLGNRVATIGMAGTEANQLAPLVIQASAAVDRTKFPALNSVILAAEKGVGDPNVVKLGISVNSLINAYARAINPFGTSTVSDKDHARELLSDAWSHGQIQSGVAQLQKEIDAARKSPGIVKEELRRQYGQGGSQGQQNNNDPLGIR